MHRGGSRVRLLKPLATPAEGRLVPASSRSLYQSARRHPPDGCRSGVLLQALSNRAGTIPGTIRSSTLGGTTNKAADQRVSWSNLAEGEGFEPPERFPVQWFSRPPPSTTRPSLRAHSASISQLHGHNPRRAQCRRKCCHLDDARLAGRQGILLLVGDIGAST